MDVRDATPADHALLLQGLDALMAHIIPGEPYFERMRPRERFATWIDESLADPDGRGLIAEDGAGLLGCALGKLQDPAMPISDIGRVGYLAMLWVAPRARRRGLARRLSGIFEDWCRDRGAAWVELSWLCANREAEVTWPELGYRPFRIQARKRL